MKSQIVALASLLLVCSGFAQTQTEPSASPEIRWICRTEKSRWQELVTTNAPEAAAVDVIKLDPQTKFQTIDGFGGCFNELGWEALAALLAEKSQTVKYNSEFYAMKHFSATVLPGARRIAVSGRPFKEVFAFQNPDGSKVLAFANDTAQTVSATVAVGGDIAAFECARSIHEHGDHALIAEAL